MGETCERGFGGERVPARAKKRRKKQEIEQAVTLTPAIIASKAAVIAGPTAVIAPLPTTTVALSPTPIVAPQKTRRRRAESRPQTVVAARMESAEPTGYTDAARAAAACVQPSDCTRYTGRIEANSVQRLLF